MFSYRTLTTTRGARSSARRLALAQRPGVIPGYGMALTARTAEEGRLAVGSSGSGEPTVGRLGESRGDTVHFDIVDSRGNMIAATPSGG